MVSLKQVAERAGVSVPTVSRMLAGTGYVSEGAAMRIRVSIRALGYAARAVRPGPKPKSMRGIRTGNIALVSLDEVSPEEMLRMPAFPALLGGVQNALAQRGLALVLAHAHEGQVPSVLHRNRVDGVLIMGGTAPLTPRLRQALLQLPAVWCFRRHADALGDFDHVFYDNARVGDLAADYFLGRGLKRLAFLTPRGSHSAYAQRRERFVASVSARGGEVGVYLGDSVDVAKDAACVEQLVGEMLRAGPPPQGLFVPADHDLLAAFQALVRKGVQPQRDVLLLGCNADPQFLMRMQPRPASITIQSEAVGRRAVEQLLWRVSNRGETQRTETFILPAVLEGEPDAAVSVSA
jgi:DNA-binding LacI/PurR family transcriptional regulator